MTTVDTTRTQPGRADDVDVSAARLFLVRHAESTGNAARIVQGNGPYTLSQAGVEHVRRVAASLRGAAPDLVVASHVRRAIDTARLLYGRVDRIDRRLGEQKVGQWVGRTLAELETAHPIELEGAEAHAAGFEAAAEVITRVNEACTELLAAGRVVVAVTHGAVLWQMTRHS